MKYLLILILISCSRTPQKKSAQKLSCISMREMEVSVERVRELTKQIQIEDKRLTEITKKNLVLSEKFQRLTESFDHASPQSLPKLQKKRDELTLEAAENDEEGKAAQQNIARLKKEIGNEFFKVNNSDICSTP